MSLNQVTVTVDNAAPDAGTNLTPVWVGFHNGGFDTYDRGEAASPGLERLAEDGNNAVISQEFADSGFGNVDGTLGNAPIAPGTTVRQTFNLDDSQGRFFNYASMILPSNDTFIANGNPLVHEIYDEFGNFLGADFFVSGAEALDAGTEVNDEIPENTAFFGQTLPDTGEVENGTVQLATGFQPVEDGGILADPRFANADYTTPDYQVARIRVSSRLSARLSSELTADQEVPGGGDPNASGSSELLLNEFGDALSYRLTVSGLDFGQFLGDGSAQTADTSDDVTRIHLHSAPRGENGDVAFGLIDLVAPAADGQDNDDLEITQNDDGSVTLQGIWELTDPALTSLSEFVDDIQTADSGADIPLYWNVHTHGSPGGAIRGQLQDDRGVAQVVDELQNETVVLGSDDALTVNRGGELDVDGTAVEVEQRAQNARIDVNRGGTIDGSFNGVNFANGGESRGILTNEGRISSESRAVNLGGRFNRLDNSGRIDTTADPRNGTVYADQSAQAFAIHNDRRGRIDAGAGNQGDAISLQLGAEVTGSIVNDGTIRGRGDRSSTSNSESSAIRLYWGDASGSTFNGDIVNSSRLLAEGGSGILIEDQTVLNGEIRNSGLIQGDFRGINFANGGRSAGHVVNERGGRIQSAQRAINIGGADVSVENNGRIRALESPSDGVIYGDQTAERIAIDNQQHGVIDLAPGTQGDAISLELGASVSGEIRNAGLIAGRGAVSSTTNSQSSAIRLYWGDNTGEPVSVFNGDIENSGRLTSQQGATILIEDRTELNGEIINSGRIIGGREGDGRLAIDASQAEGNLLVRNTGRIDGDVLLTSGDDTYNGTRGRIFGSVAGGDGNDLLLGGLRNGPLLGGAGNDTLVSGSGRRNVLEGGTGSDVLVAGSRRDIFTFGADLLQDEIADVDKIQNFERSDRLDFSEYFNAGGSISAIHLNVGRGDSSLINLELSSGDKVSISGDVLAALDQTAHLL